MRAACVRCSRSAVSAFLIASETSEGVITRSLISTASAIGTIPSPGAFISAMSKSFVAACRLDSAILTFPRFIAFKALTVYSRPSMTSSGACFMR